MSRAATAAIDEGDLGFLRGYDLTMEQQMYLSIPDEAREEFAQKYCAEVYACNGGQACVVITYPHNEKVWMYDMDSGEFFRVKLEELFDFIEKVYRKSEEADFCWPDIMDSDHCDEAGDISYHLFG